MAIIQGGVSTSLAEVGVGTSLPLHTSNRPIPYGSLGHYRLAATTGTVAAALAAGGQIFTLRWTHATNLFVLLYCKVSFQTLMLFTAAQQVDFGFDLKKAMAVSAGGGGTALTGFSKMRTSMGATNLSSTDVRISTTAALTALTTLDTNAICSSLGDMQRMNPAAATEEQRVNDPTLLYAPNVANGEHPLTLAQNEGFVIANRTVWPAAGTGLFTVEISWAEVTAY